MAERKLHYWALLLDDGTYFMVKGPSIQRLQSTVTNTHLFFFPPERIKSKLLSRVICSLGAYSTWIYTTQDEKHLIKWTSNSVLLKASSSWYLATLQPGKAQEAFCRARHWGWCSGLSWRAYHWSPYSLLSGSFLPCPTRHGTYYKEKYSVSQAPDLLGGPWRHSSVRSCHLPIYFKCWGAGPSYLQNPRNLSNILLLWRMLFQRPLPVFSPLSIFNELQFLETKATREIFFS